MKSVLLITTVLLAAVSSAADVTGKWVGTMKLPSAIKPTGGKVITKGGPTYSLTIEKGGKYQMVTKSPNGKEMKSNGTWKLKGSDLTLTPSAESVKQTPALKERVLKVSAKGDVLTTQIQVKLASSPPVVHTGKGGEKVKIDVTKPPKDAKPTMISIEFKRPLGKTAG
jgi:hypothetical protein